MLRKASSDCRLVVHVRRLPPSPGEPDAGAVVGATTTTAGFANDRRWCPTPRPSSAPTPTPTTAAPSPAPTKLTVSEWTELTTPDGEEGHCTPYGMLCDTNGAAYGSSVCDDFYTSGDMMGSHPCRLGGWDESVACVRELCEGSELCGGYTFSPDPYWWSVSLYPVGFGAPTYRLANTHCWKKPDASSAGAVVGASTTTAAFAGGADGPSCKSKRGRDSKSWHQKDDPTKTCKWVKRNRAVRCRKKGATGTRAYTECVRACGSCPCVDDVAWSHTNKKNKRLTCVSVARSAGRRCALPGAAAACKQTCGGC